MKSVFLLLVLPAIAAAQNVTFNYNQAPPPVRLDPMIAVQIGGGAGCYGERTGCVGAPRMGCISAAPRMGCIAAPPRMGCIGTAPATGCVGYTAGAYYEAPRVGYVPVIRRGAPLPDGRYATESGYPLPPGILPWDGPIVGTLRAAAGYNRRR
jgi:hypothetical protein